MNRLKEIRAGDFTTEVLDAPTPVVVLFDAPDCAPCDALKPMIHEVSGNFRGEVDFVSVDVSKSPGLARRYGIVVSPTLGLFYDGVLRDVFRPSTGGETPFF
jgi:thioredoxin 1